MRFIKLAFILLVLVLSDACHPTKTALDKKSDNLPNIVLIFADDLGYGDLDVYGNIGIETPNIRKMAQEGVRLTDFHSATAVCSASRAAILTGCYPDRVSVHGAYMPDAREGLHPDEVTFAEVAKERGYATGIFGKWHLGDNKETLPLSQGFDEYLGIPYSNDMWPIYYDGNKADSINCKDIPWKVNMPELPLIKDYVKIRGIKNLDEQGELTTLITEGAVDFIKRNKAKPFFLYVPHPMPHVPLGVSAKFKGKSSRGLYGDVIMELDWSVGQILQTLKDQGLDQNTLVVFTSDNGPWLNYGDHSGSTAGLREGKGTMWEGGHRVPCIIRWPNKIKPGETKNDLAMTMDLFSTFTKIIGGRLPNKKIDGIDLSDHLFNGKPSSRKQFLGYYGAELAFVRKANFKLILPHVTRSYLTQAPGNGGYPGSLTYPKLKTELYDLANDPYEKTDISSLFPEKVKELEVLADSTRLVLGDKITKIVGKEVRSAWRKGGGD
jgi:arylsulfatase A-like enzyme